MIQSIPLPAIELVNLEPTQYSPLISKCQIKVCYVSDEPNRNTSVINKETGIKMAPSLRGAAIVGYYNEEKKDFEGHERTLEISDGELYFKDITQPYGFVDLNAKVWFQKFMEQGIEREYLMTEGYLWTKQYPECQRVIDKGNNQSMELDEDSLDAHWAKYENGTNKFFIISDAIISKLCILGEDVEPCFEGAEITNPKIKFSFEEDFKEQLFSMMNEIKDILNKGGKPKMNIYAVQVGDSLWNSLFERFGKEYRIDGVFEEDGQKFAVAQNKETEVYFKLNFELNEEVFSADEELTELTDYTPAEEPQFSAEEVAEFEKSAEEKEDEGKEEICEKCGKPVSECDCKDDDDDDKKDYNLEEIVEYVELAKAHNTLTTEYENLKAEKETLEASLNELKQFKLDIERKEKQDMIDSFNMLSASEKQDCVDNIDVYSLSEIEAKLSIICVRNRVDFKVEDKEKDPTVYNLKANHHSTGSDKPDWVKAMDSREKM